MFDSFINTTNKKEGTYCKSTIPGVPTSKGNQYAMNTSCRSTLHVITNAIRQIRLRLALTRNGVIPETYVGQISNKLSANDHACKSSG